MDKNKVWFTYKARIQAHARLDSNDFHSQTLLVWYAFNSAALSIASISNSELLGKDTATLGAVISVAILAISMLVTNRDFRGRALKMRDNYLALERLLNRNSQDHLPPQEVAVYSDLLAAVENHTEIDDKRFRVLQRKHLNTRQPSKLEIADFYAYTAMRTITFAFLYIAPLTLIFLIK